MINKEESFETEKRILKALSKSVRNEAVESKSLKDSTNEQQSDAEIPEDTEKHILKPPTRVIEELVDQDKEKSTGKNKVPLPIIDTKDQIITPETTKIHNKSSKAVKPDNQNL